MNGAMEPVSVGGRPMETWISEAALSSDAYADYWNDEQAEHGKAWNVADGDFGRMERYLDELGLPADIAHAVTELNRRGTGLRGAGIDLAAGNLWAAPHLLKLGDIKRLYSLEYSRHRLLKLGPLVLSHYDVPDELVVLVWGSFYDLALPDASLDFALLSQAYHHADHPLTLLRELCRVLKPGSPVIIVGEHVIGWRAYARYYTNACASVLPTAVRSWIGANAGNVTRSLRPGGAQLEPVDPVLGDHVYTRGEYAAMFSAAGFDHVRLRRPGSSVQGFLLIRK